MRKDNKLSKIIIGMLKENTGRHFLNSGGAYGRHWERNQSCDFTKLPVCTYDIGTDGEGSFSHLNVSFHVYHFLMAHLDLGEHTDKLNKLYKDYDASRPDDYDLQIMEDFTQHLHTSGGHSATNTYNFENILSQTLQYVEFDYEGDTYIILQIHGGCDVRGGYTRPRIFRLVEPDYFTMSMFDVDVYCPGLSDDERRQLTLTGKDEGITNHNWWSDDCGYHFYTDSGRLTFSPKVEDDKLYCQFCGKPLTVSVRDQW